ncbi:pentapeptide repeat-containing protein [Streptomyces scabiei]|uniref:pentapeptide repeat-containing protein n=1 Tax=Streptomyces scabiei TaxID=1930 RepID=UPI001FF0CD3B|nr:MULTISPECIES: pentapeptide repeat-containing protein [Streptomyces]MDW8471041.1 pentapeptide repeat-containing protein [Streptomyces scabiei]MDX2573352.1 pentapeptide repeat-containing protein [Streptomyces scabiei]MDX2628792.1 pentapeptide repeat-containing protein [Streptomyces scabiei]MDX3147012.1 pentapeptide repeat-containing protein [Streptomyces scabiei]MDX3155247.1 pentapeptide repeat-containing protein [Streptomyces scabiei]
MDMGEPDRGRRARHDGLVRRRTAAGVLAAAAGLVILGTVFVVLPGVVVDHDLAGASVAAQDRLKAVNDVRTALLQVVGGLVVLFGAYATWRQLRVSQDGLRATQEGYVTDRFSRAVDQLGSDKLDVRIGGLHALWRIAEQSARDREAIISLQAAYLRTHLPWPPAGPESPAADVPINDIAPLETRAADAQVALTALGVLCRHREQSWVNLSITDLRRADCDGLWFPEVNFDRACLEAAGLYHANLTQASLVSVNLRHADLTTAILRRARCVLADLRAAKLVGTDLRDADFTETDLREANLRKADAHGAVFHRADLRMADVRGTDLSTANLVEARLTGALASEHTRWPAGFDPTAAGVVDTDDPGPEPSPLLQPPGMTWQAAPLRSAP